MIRRAITLCSICIVALLCGRSALYALDTSDTVQWTPVAEDLERASVPIPVNLFSTARMELFRTSTHRYRVSIVRASEFGSKVSDIKTLCSASKGVVCINANFFDEQNRPLGLIMERGNVLQKMHRGGNALTGVLQQSRDGVSIVNRLDFSPGKILEAIQAGPRLVVRGQPVKGLKERETPLRRSGVCVDPNKRLILFVIQSTFFGPAVNDIQKTLLHRDIACWDALNLDGGSSTQLYFSGGTALSGENVPPSEIRGETHVPVIISLVTKD